MSQKRRLEQIFVKILPLKATLYSKELMCSVILSFDRLACVSPDYAVLYSSTLKRHFLHPFVAFKNSVVFPMLSTGLRMHRQILADSHRHCAVGDGGENGYLWYKKGIGRKVFSGHFLMPEKLE